MSKKLNYHKIIVDESNEKENKEGSGNKRDPVKVEDNTNNYRFNDQYVLKLDNTLLTAIHMNNDLDKAKIIAKQLDCFNSKGKDIVIHLKCLSK